ncbi:cob(I)yrinic acid a,c-diamide adenosyltransferase [Pseudopedobacter sp.]|uniref:cob(I)yrinic acid a,c-diamide adenosyltransferase n=1 Tax=Pseudopedobacter sp. TaxID=1936787 RepID=UPI00333F67DA
MKIYTKTGDKGHTSLIGGTRVPKYHLRIEAYGTVDELNSYLGLIKDQEIEHRHKEVLKEIQDRLFTIGALLASDPDKTTKKIPNLFESDVELLEKEMDLMTDKLPDLKHFILPGGCTASSFCHIARCVCRRAERLTVELSENSQVEGLVVIYLNRLSDYLFVLSRKINFNAGAEENNWIPRL